MTHSELTPLISPPNGRGELPVVFLQFWMEDVKVESF